MTEQTKVLSKQALNKITKNLYDGGEYDSKTYQKFVKIKAEFDLVRKAVNEEMEQVLNQINEDQESFMNTRAFKKLDEDSRWDSLGKFEESGYVVQKSRMTIGYSYDGYDTLSELWQSSSMRC